MDMVFIVALDSFGKIPASKKHVSVMSVTMPSAACSTETRYLAAWDAKQ